MHTVPGEACGIHLRRASVGGLAVEEVELFASCHLHLRMLLQDTCDRGIVTRGRGTPSLALSTKTVDRPRGQRITLSLGCVLLGWLAG